MFSSMYPPSHNQSYSMFSQPPPAASSSISIDDLIQILQEARDSSTHLKKEITQLRSMLPKPIDLNKTKQTYYVAHKMFANTQVWQIDGPMYTDLDNAKQELNRLSRNPTNESVEYKILTAELKVYEEAVKSTPDSVQINDNDDDDSDIEWQKDQKERNKRLYGDFVWEQEDTNF